MTNNPENSADTRTVAIVLASHGDRGGDFRNRGLAAHVKALSEGGQFRLVTGGVLNGEPSLEQAFSQAEQSGAEWILVYPMFMSAGYFAAEELPRRVKAANLSVLTSILQPFGVDHRTPLLLLEGALRAAKASNVNPSEARLLVVGHGSKHGPANADATRAAAKAIEERSPFARIDTAFIEEEPFVTDTLSQFEGSTVVAGFFSGDGMHSGKDIPDAIRESGVAATYTGPVGLHPRVPELVVSSAMRALKSRSREPEREPQSVPERLDASHATAPPGSQPVHKKRSFLQSLSSGTKGIRFVIRAALALILIAILGVAALAFLVPEDTVREQVTSLVKQKTGRDLTIGGDISITWFPNIGVRLADVRVSNPPGMKQGDTLRVDALTVDLKLLPLISRRVEVDRFVLTKPVFNLVADAQGRKNWEIEKKSASRADESRQKQIAPRIASAQTSAAGTPVVEDIRLGTVKIVDGAVNFVDERAGTRQNIKALNVSVVQPRLSDPLHAQGDLIWREKKISFNTHVGSVPALLRNQASPVRLDLTVPDGKVNFDGKLLARPEVSVSGKMSASTPSLRALAQWMDNPLPPGGGLGAASIAGQARYEGKILSFTKAQLGVDGMKGTGQASIRLAGAKPLVTASLSLDKLDLNPYLQYRAGTTKSGPKAAPVGGQSEPAASGPAPKPKSGQSLTDFIKKLDKTGETQEGSRPQVRGWSQRAFDFGGLRAVDANVKLTTGAIFYKDIDTSQSALTISLKNGILTADLTKLALYSGAGTGRITLNSAREVPAMAAAFNLKGISALPLLKDASKFDWISGRANIELKLSGAGRSQEAMVQDLQGSGRFSFTDGAIEGINIPAMVRGLKQGEIDGWKRADRAKTDFSQLSASFVVQKGIAYNKDLSLIGPLVRMTGEGNVDLGREQLDYAALPRIVANLQGQGAVDDPKRGLAVPVRITGPWGDPKIVPDLERLMNDPELAQETVEKVGKVIEKLKNKEDVNKLLKGLLGGGNQEAPDGAPQQGEQDKPEDILKKLFR